jgi:peptide/nickel transport system substrate-binding protein
MTGSPTLEGGAMSALTRAFGRRRVAVTAALLTVVVAAVGAAAATAGSHQAGGTITVLSAGDVDHIDPGQAYYSFTYEISYATQRPLLSYRPNSINAIPDLASAMPKYSNGGKTVTVHIRPGVRFSPPVNREVTSADVKYAIDRAFSSSVANGYAGAYFGDVVGAPRKATKGVPDIKGIQTPSKDTIVFRLKRPDGVFTGSLGLLMTAPVPQEYAKRFDSQTTSTYGMHQVATGPYMIKNDSSGNINGVGYKPGQLIDLVRNPNWSAKTSWRPAHASEVLFKEGYQDPTVMTRTILSGSADVNGDSPPPPAELRSIMTSSSERKQLHFTPAGGSRYVALNTSKAPFDKLAVRQAVATVLDRNAMRLTRGGAIDGRIATHFLDPSFKTQGFAQSGGLAFNPFPSAGFRGSVPKAKALMRKAGYANGMYSGPQVTMVADNSPPGSNTAQVVAAGLAKIGFHVKTISVTHSTMYTKYCNVPKNEPNICPNVGWLPDFHEPQAVLNVTFAGDAITPVNNSNWPLLNDPKINAAIAHARTIVSPQARWAAWGKIDEMVTRSAAAVPWVWENFPSVYSKRVTPAPELWNGGSPDVTFMSVSGS